MEQYDNGIKYSEDLTQETYHIEFIELVELKW